MVKHGIMHVHSMYSLNDSTQTPEEIVLRAKELGCDNITLTDHGTLLGIDSFMEAGEKYGVNTIPGVETYIDDRQHLILVAKNYKGFQAISKALREANTNQVIKTIKGKNMVYPILSKEMFEILRGNENIIVTSACIQGPIAVILLRNYYIQKSIDKIKNKMDSCRESYQLYNNAAEKYQSVSEQIKGYNNDKKSFIKYTKEPYRKSTEKKKQQLTSILKDLTMYVSTEELTNAQVKKYHKAVEKKGILEKEIKERESLIESAESTVTFSEKRISELNKLRLKWKKIRDTHETKKKRYEKLQKEIEQVQLIDEKKLYKEALKMAVELKDTFPNFYIELQYHGLEQEKYVMPLLLKIANETGIPVIAANDAHMKDASKEAIVARQIVRYNYFSKHQEVSDADRTLYLKSDEELLNALCEVIPPEDAEIAINNTAILKECKVVFPNEKHYPVCKSDKSFRELLDEAKQKKIYNGLWSDTYENRLNHEVKIIEEMGFVDYHMIVRDFCFAGRSLGSVPQDKLDLMPVDYQKAIEWIRSQGYKTGVGVGPGRGSAVGSLVCYLLGITNIDPIRYNLLFERFLNPERVTMPDIDTDIKTSLRPYIIRYIKQKYGERAVCSIMTENTYAAKASTQMVGRDRADELYADDSEKKKEYMRMVGQLSDLIPEGPAGKLSTYDKVISKHFPNDAEIDLLWNRAKLIEGRVSSTGTHAGGIVISDNDDINEYVPLAWKEDKQVWAAQRDMIRIEQKGLLKVDLLGLNTLDCESDCVQLIEKNYGITIQLDDIPFEKEVFEEIYSKGRTNSVFQFESAGMKQMLKDFKPNCIEDIILLVAAYRPGPMEFLPSLIDVKHGRKPLVYLTPELEPILSSTYGQIIYQEQVMQIFQDLAGYSLGQADLVRRAMSKKKEEKLLIERESFIYGDDSRKISGCVKRGISTEIANVLFDNMIDFAKYAFNKSHAAAYAVVSYQTAWLKYHYPKEFLCAMFNNKESDNYGPIIEDSTIYKIELLPPDINNSFYNFTTEGDAIRYGFKGIKNIANADTVDPIVKERSGVRTMEYYKSFADFVERNITEDNEKSKLFEKRLMEALIKSGCFDSIESNREQLYKEYEYASFDQAAKSVIAYFKNYEYSDMIDKKVLRNWEAEYLKYFMRENPLKGYRDDSYYGCVPYNQLPEGNTSVLGLLSSYEDKISKNGNKMIIVHLQGKTDKLSVLFLKDKYERFKNDISALENTVVRISGSCKDGTIFGNDIEKLEPNKNTYYYICDSEEKYRVILKEGTNRGLEELNVFTYFKGTTEDSIQRLNTPVMLRIMTTKHVIKKIQAEKEK